MNNRIIVDYYILFPLFVNNNKRKTLDTKGGHFIEINVSTHGESLDYGTNAL
jgi:hypothetical protein